MNKRTLHTRWTPKDDRLLLEMHSRGESFYKIAKNFGITKESIVGRWHKIKPKKSEKEINRTWSYVI